MYTAIKPSGDGITVHMKASLEVSAAETVIAADDDDAPEPEEELELV
jgi:hypothetical protein